MTVARNLRRHLRRGEYGRVDGLALWTQLWEARLTLPSKWTAALSAAAHESAELHLA